MMSVGGSLRRGRGLFVLLVLGLLAGWAVGCTQFSALKLADSDADPATTTEDAALELNASDDGTAATSCGLS